MNSHTNSSKLFSRTALLSKIIFLLSLALFSTVIEKAFATSPPSSQLSDEKISVQAYLAKNPKDAKILSPFKDALDAEIAVVKNDRKQASKLFKQALKTIDGDLGESIFTAYLDNESVLYGLSDEQKRLNHLIKIQKKHPIKLLSGYSVKNRDAMKRALSKLVPSMFKPDKPDRIESDLSAPSLADMAKDPLFIEISENYCASQYSLSYKRQKEWESWAKTLEAAQKQYWTARTNECSGRAQLASSQYETIMETYKNSETAWIYALWSAKRVVIWQRQNSQRKKAAINYKALAELWLESSPNPVDFGLEKSELLREKANDLLWAARYRALLGHYEEATRYSREAIKVAKLGLQHVSPTTKKNTVRDLKEYVVEGFQTPADRVHVERNEFKIARDLILKAKAEESPEKAWDDRLSWYDGFYAFLEEDYKNALAGFDELLSQTQEDGVKAKAMFWKTRTLLKLRETEKARALAETLVATHPLSYYSVVAVPLVFADSKVDQGIPSWQSALGFGTVSEKPTNNEHHFINFDLSAFKHVDQGVELANASKVLLEAGLKRYAHDMVFDLYRRSRSKISMIKRPETFIFLSRLLYKSENYIWAITVSNQLYTLDEKLFNRYPEQLNVLYPRPFNGVYSKASKDSQIPENLLYSISRQESAFNKVAVSPAKAFGLMQIIVPTAKTLLKQSGQSHANIAEALVRPKVNVDLGALYLRNLGKRYENVGPYVYAAYNAGEGAVDTWLERRDFRDRLAWVEAIPYGETRQYVKNIARNMAVYSWLQSNNKTKL